LTPTFADTTRLPSLPEYPIVVHRKYIRQQQQKNAKSSIPIQSNNIVNNSNHNLLNENVAQNSNILYDSSDNALSNQQVEPSITTIADVHRSANDIDYCDQQLNTNNKLVIVDLLISYHFIRKSNSTITTDEDVSSLLETSDIATMMHSFRCANCNVCR
jgi:hypothetical protein